MIGVLGMMLALTVVALTVCPWYSVPPEVVPPHSRTTVDGGDREEKSP